MNFGKPIRSEWLLDDDVIFLNHGSFGACPKSVLAVQCEWQERLESEPVRFMIRELPVHLDAVRRELAEFVGSAPEDLVFVQNATEGANAVMSSLVRKFQPGDELLTTSHVYGAIWQTMNYVAELTGVTVVVAPTPFPISDEEEVVEAIREKITSRTVFAVIDHITSPTGMIFPVEKMIALFKARGIPVLVDGAHVPGQIDLDLSTLGADYYVGNCHKWLFSPKGSALLWVDKKHQPTMHPTVISHRFGEGYQDEFGWTGTLDPTAWLSIPAGLAFHRRVEAAGARDYTRTLIQNARRDITGALGVPFGAPEHMLANMCTFSLPGDPAATPEKVFRLHDTLFDNYGIEVPAMMANGKLYVRASANVYNEAGDYEKLQEALVELVTGI